MGLLDRWRRKTEDENPPDRLVQASEQLQKGTEALRGDAALLAETVLARRGSSVTETRQFQLRQPETTTEVVLRRSELGKAALEVFMGNPNRMIISFPHRESQVVSPLEQMKNPWALWALAEWVVHLHPHFPDSDDRLAEPHIPLLIARKAVEIGFERNRDIILSAKAASRQRNADALESILDGAQTRARETLLQAAACTAKASDKGCSIGDGFLRLGGNYDIGGDLMAGFYTDIRGTIRVLFVYDTLSPDIYPHPDTTVALLAAAFGKAEVDAEEAGISVSGLRVSFVEGNLLGKYSEALGFTSVDEDEDDVGIRFGTFRSTLRRFRRTLLEIVQSVGKVIKTTEFCKPHKEDTLDETDETVVRHLRLIEVCDDLFLYRNRVTVLSGAIEHFLKRLRNLFEMSEEKAQPKNKKSAETGEGSSAAPLPVVKVTTVKFLAWVQAMLGRVQSASIMIRDISELALTSCAYLSQQSRSPHFEGQDALVASALQDYDALNKREGNASLQIAELERIVGLAEGLTKAMLAHGVKQLNAFLVKHCGTERDPKSLQELRVLEGRSGEVRHPRYHFHSAQRSVLLVRNMLTDWTQALTIFHDVLHTFGLDCEKLAQHEALFKGQVLISMTAFQDVVAEAFRIARDVVVSSSTKVTWPEDLVFEPVDLMEMKCEGAPDRLIGDIPEDVATLAAQIRGEKVRRKKQRTVGVTDSGERSRLSADDRALLDEIIREE